uniref:DnaJ_C domain-containing protein n=1 Tax=Steinernema glaseri TaxID=37863 RepID=A0A1I7Y5N5_9BILA
KPKPLINQRKAGDLRHAKMPEMIGKPIVPGQIVVRVPRGKYTEDGQFDMAEERILDSIWENIIKLD